MVSYFGFKFQTNVSVSEMINVVKTCYKLISLEKQKNWFYQKNLLKFFTCPADFELEKTWFSTTSWPLQESLSDLQKVLALLYNVAK